MSLPSKEAVQRFLGGLGDTEEAVAESLQGMGARDAEGLGTRVPIIRNCVMAMALRIAFPELNDEGDWSTGASFIRLGVEYVPTPGPVAGLIEAVDRDRWKLRDRWAAYQPRYPNLLSEDGS